MKKRVRNACVLANLLATLWMLCSSNPVQAAAGPGSPQQQSVRTFTIIEPPARTPLSGTYWLVVSSSDKSIASVEYSLGSKRLGIAVSPPFKLSWNTAYAADGTSAVQAIARDTFGTPVATAEQIFTIKNHGNSIAATQPDLALPIRSVVTLRVSGEDLSYYPALWLAYVDGEQVAAAWTDNLGKHAASVTMHLDTTTFTNGRHELYIGMHSDYWQPGHQEKVSFYNFRAGIERVVNIDNGHTLMEIAANYLHVYLRPGERTNLRCRQLFTDNTAGPCSAPLYTISDPKVASVSRTGVVTAGLNPGFATITITDAAKITSVRVWVRKNQAIPHFSGSGQMLDSYQAGASLFMVSPFVLQPSDLKADSRLLSEVKLAGVNTLSRGFYSNPRSIRGDYAGWRRSFYESTVPDWIFARDHGFHIFATGDDVARGIGEEAWWTLNWPSGKKAVQYAMQQLATSGVAIGVDMVDEASMMWGWTPRPPGKIGAPDSFKSITCSGMTCTVAWPHSPVTPKRFPSGLKFDLDHSVNRNLNTPPGQMFTANHVGPDSFDFTPAGPVTGKFTAINNPRLEFVWWAGNIGGCPTQPCIPPVPNSALTQISSWVEAARPSVPISWPVLGVAPPVVQGNWMGPHSVSDYASHYWDSLSERHTYPWSGGVQEFNYWMRELFYSRQSLMMLDRPQLFLTSISSFMYDKRAAGSAYYMPPIDQPAQPGASGPVITSEIMAAAALGGAGVRLYQFESPANLANRIKAPVGTTLQTGANPTASDPIIRENWRAMAYAANPLTKSFTPYVLGAALTSPAYGRNIVTAARQSNSGRLLMAINGNDWARTVPIDFKPYRTGQNVIRYLIRYDGIETNVFPDGPGQTITLRAGESVVYIFPATLQQYAGAVKIGPPGGTNKAVLHYGYIYKEALPQQLTGIECTRGCTLRLDRSLGPVFYQFDYLNSSAKNLLSRSAIFTLGVP
jgi:hypothetical protein